MSGFKDAGRYRRTSNRHSWNESDMKKAIEAIKSKSMGWLLASRTFKVPFGTLRRRAVQEQGWKKGYIGGRKNTFNKELEHELVTHVKEMQAMFFGLTTEDVRRLAFEIAESRQIPHRFSKEKKMAGFAWLSGFRLRNTTISLRPSDSALSARDRAFNKNQIRNYFDLLSRILEEHKFQPNDIWNVDDTGLTTVPSKDFTKIDTKRRKQVGMSGSAKVEQHLTVVCCMNAIGSYIPPALIFPGKKLEQELIDGAPIGSVAFAQENGYMDSETFLNWLIHFVKIVKPSQDNKVLLLLDGHRSHKSLINALLYAKANGVVIFSFPSQCSHLVQPLDVSFYNPLVTQYHQELSNWLQCHPGQVISHLEVASLFHAAYIKAATMQNALTGFAATGIVPFNPNIFPEWMFAAGDDQMHQYDEGSGTDSDDS